MDLQIVDFVVIFVLHLQKLVHIIDVIAVNTFYASSRIPHSDDIVKDV